MWEGAEPTSGLACERIRTDGVYPENDADIVTTEVVVLVSPGCW